MLSWRGRRQLIAVIVVFSIAGYFAVSAIQKFLPEPTCFDQRKNQNELGIDCGGSCDPCELKNLKPVAVYWARAFPVRPHTYDVAAEIENRNEELASPLFRYEFILYDSLGPLARKTGSAYLLRQERSFVVETNLTTTREPNLVELRILGVDWEVNRGPRYTIAVERRDYRVREEDGRKQSVVEAGIFNNTPYDFRFVEVQFAVFDPQGNAIGVNKVLVDDLRSGARRTVTSIWPEVLAGEAATVRVEPRVNMFDPNVIITPR